MKFPLGRRRPNAGRRPNSILAFSIALHLSGAATPANEACAFVAPDPRRHLPFVAPSPQRPSGSRAMSADDGDDEPVSGSFFNEVPPPKDDASDADGGSTDADADATPDFPGGDDADLFGEILQSTRLSRTPEGFSKTTPTTDHAAPSVIQAPGDGRSFVGIGKPLNDATNPEYDEDGYTLYADEATGEKKRVFEALVEYPSLFQMKIVGRDEDDPDAFVPSMVEVVARSCGVEPDAVRHTERKNGKWTSVTVHAPVESADMLYKLYENVDGDPRVKFKF